MASHSDTILACATLMSKAKKPPYGQILLGILLGFVAFAWSLYGIPLSELWHDISQAKWQWLLLVAVLFMIQQLLRAARQMLIIQAQYPEHTFAKSFAILCIGFFFINTLPARIGEAVRPILLKRDGIPLGNGIALIFTERTIDLCAALIMFAATLGQLNIEALNNPIIQKAQHLVLFLLPALILLLTSFIFLGQHIRPHINKWLSRSFLSRFLPFMNDFIDAMNRLDTKRLAAVLTLTVLTWGLTGWMTVAGLAAFDLHEGRGFLDGISILAFTMLGMAAPSAPGFAGAYEAAVILGCISIGMNNVVRITAFAITFHWWVHLVQSLSALAYSVHPQYGFGVVINQLRHSFSGSDTHKPASPDAQI